MHNLFDFFEKHIEKSKPILIGLSGGPDSLCLLYNLLEWGKAQIHIVHVDHGWRQESTHEALTLQKLASDLQVPFHMTVLQGLKGNLELASREARYEFFQKVADEVGAEAIVLGHQADDVSETVLKRVLEGASFCTFGIPKVGKIGSLTLLRPLLCYTKEEILTWLDKRGISYFSDPTNLQAKYLRGRMRSEIFPYLRDKFGKNFEKSLCHLGDESRELYHFLEEAARSFREKAIVGPWGTYFSEMPREAYLFKHLLKPGFSREQLDLAYEIIQLPNKEIHTKEKSIFIDRGRLFLTGKMSSNDWQIITRTVENPKTAKNHFTDIWKGYATTYLPTDKYSFTPTRSLERSKAKAPAFLSTVVPAVVKDGVIFEDFLSGKKCAVEGPCLEIILSLQERN